MDARQARVRGGNLLQRERPLHRPARRHQDRHGPLRLLRGAAVRSLWPKSAPAVPPNVKARVERIQVAAARAAVAVSNHRYDAERLKGLLRSIREETKAVEEE